MRCLPMVWRSWANFPTCDSVRRLATTAFPRRSRVDGVNGTLERHDVRNHEPDDGPERLPEDREPEPARRHAAHLYWFYFSLCVRVQRVVAFQLRNPSSKNPLGVLETRTRGVSQRVAAKTRVENSRASGVRPLESSSGCSPGACAGLAEQPRSFTQAYACRTRL